MIAAKAADMAAPAFSRPCLVRAVASSSIDWNVTGAGGVLNSEANPQYRAQKGETRTDPLPHADRIATDLQHVKPVHPSLSAPRITIIRFASGNGLCSALASSHGARIHTSRSSSVVKITGMSFWWIGSTTAIGAVVRKCPPIVGEDCGLSF